MGSCCSKNTIGIDNRTDPGKHNTNERNTNYDVNNNSLIKENSSLSIDGRSLIFPDPKTIDVLTHTPPDPKSWIRIEQTFWKEKAKLIPDYRVMEKIDEHVLKAPNALRKDPPKLIAYLMKPCKTEVEKARAILRWMGENIQYDTHFLQTGIFGDCSAENVILTGKAVCEGYSNACLLLASLAGLESMKMSGQAKGAGYHPGEIDSSRLKDGSGGHAWNALQIDGKFYLSDATWAAGSVDTAKNTFTKNWKEAWFFTHPEDFGLTHIPLDGNTIQKDEQLLNVPVTDPNIWAENPLVCQQAHVYGIKPVTHHRNIIETTVNEITIQFSCSYPLNIFSSLIRRQKQGNQVMETSGLDDCVALFKGKGVLTAVIRLPQNGTYELEFWGYIEHGHSNLSTSMQLLSYKIINKSNAKSIHFPKGLNKNWGLSQNFLNANYKMISPQEPIVKTTNGGAHITLELPSKGEIPNMYILTYTDDKGKTTNYDDFVLPDRNESRVTYRIQCPQKGEYRLEIYGKFEISESGKNDFSFGAAFLVQCDEAHSNAQKIGTNRSMLGPNEHFYEMGLVTSARRTTLKVKDGEARLRIKKSRPVVFMATVKNCASNKDEPDILEEIEDNDIITCKVKPKQKGLYILQLYVDIAGSQSMKYAGSYAIL